MAIVSNRGRELVFELVKALGEDPNYTKSITIHIDVDCAVTATIEKYVEVDGFSTLVKIVKTIIENES